MKISGINDAIITKNSSSSSNYLFNITTTNLSIENLTIKGYRNLIVANNNNLTIQNNQINSLGTGINLITSNGNNITNVKILNNNIVINGSNAYGIFLNVSGVVNVINNLIINNTINIIGSNSYGIFLRASKQVSNDNIHNNIIKTSGSTA